MTEHEALTVYRRRVTSPVMHGAFRKGYRARVAGRRMQENPYRAHRTANGWGRRAWEAWVDGWRAAHLALELAVV